jgi:hypothetical protein
LEAIGLLLVAYVGLGVVVSGATLLWGLVKMTLPTLIYIGLAVVLTLLSGGVIGWDLTWDIWTGVMFFWVITYFVLLLAPLGGLYLLLGGKRPERMRTTLGGSGTPAEDSEAAIPANSRGVMRCGRCYYDSEGQPQYVSGCRAHRRP